MAETVRIVGLGCGGDGIAETADGRVHVPFTLPGDIVEIEHGRGNRARAFRIVSAEVDRAPPPCRHFGTCGGCALQHMEPAAYLAWKREMVVEAFARRGITAEVEPVGPVAAESRRRAIFSAVRTARGVVLGFHRKAPARSLPSRRALCLSPRSRRSSPPSAGSPS